MNKRIIAGVTAGLLVSGCASEEIRTNDRIQAEVAFTNAVHEVAYEGGQVHLPTGVECDFDLLVGGLAVQRMLDVNVAVVENTFGDVPEHGLVDCLEGESITVRGNSGY